MNVETLCTSDDLFADVSVHKAATAKAGTFSVLPSLRADSVFSFGLPTFKDWFAKLQKFGTAKNLDDYLGVLKLRLDAFSDASCRLADHSLDNGFAYVSASKDAAAKAFAAVLDGTADGGDIVLLKSYLLRELAIEYSRRGWVLQLHIGAERYTSSRLRALAGASAVRVENPVRVRAGHVSGTVWPDRPEWGEEGARTDSINVRMVREGYARARRPGGDPRLTAAQNKAKAERLGIWRAPGRR